MGQGQSNQRDWNTEAGYPQIDLDELHKEEDKDINNIFKKAGMSYNVLDEKTIFDDLNQRNADISEWAKYGHKVYQHFIGNEDYLKDKFGAPKDYNPCYIANLAYVAENGPSPFKELAAARFALLRKYAVMEYDQSVEKVQEALTNPPVQRTIDPNVARARRRFAEGLLDSSSGEEEEEDATESRRLTNRRVTRSMTQQENSQ